MQPKFDAKARQAVLTQRHTTGTVAPTYYHEDVLVLNGDGTWQATRTYPYSDATPQTLASGSLTTERVQQLINLAFEAPGPDIQRFVDLPATIDSKLVGGGRRTISLTLPSGSHSVSVTGQAPTAFERLDQAIASATVPLTP